MKYIPVIAKLIIHLSRNVRKRTCAQDSDQPAYSSSLTGIFTGRILDSCNVSSSGQSQWAHNVKMTSYQRRCDVITSHRRWYDVILMLCACWDDDWPDCVDVQADSSHGLAHMSEGTFSDVEAHLFSSCLFSWQYISLTFHYQNMPLKIQSTLVISNSLISNNPRSNFSSLPQYFQYISNLGVKLKTFC